MGMFQNALLFWRREKLNKFNWNSSKMSIYFVNFASDLTDSKVVFHLDSTKLKWKFEKKSAKIKWELLLRSYHVKNFCFSFWIENQNFRDKSKKKIFCSIHCDEEKIKNSNKNASTHCNCRWHVVPVALSVCTSSVNVTEWNPKRNTRRWYKSAFKSSSQSPAAAASSSASPRQSSSPAVASAAARATETTSYSRWKKFN